MKPNFLVIPYALLENKSCHLTEYLVYAAVYWYQHMRAEKCTASNAAISRVSKVSERSVMRALDILEQEGFIRRFYTSEAKGKRAEIQALVAFVKSDTGVTQGCHPGHPEGDTHVTRIVRDNNNKKNVAAEPQGAYNATETRKRWYEGKDEAFQLLAFFFDKKGLWKKLDTKEKVAHTAKRHLRAARRIIAGGWSQTEVEKAISKMPQKLQDEWTLETTEKYLTK